MDISGLARGILLVEQDSGDIQKNVTGDSGKAAAPQRAASPLGLSPIAAALA